MPIYTSKKLLENEFEKREVTIEMNAEKNLTCKNGDFKFIKTAPSEGISYKYSFTNAGCTNPRANGSSRCQECSNKFHKSK